MPRCVQNWFALVALVGSLAIVGWASFLPVVSRGEESEKEVPFSEADRRFWSLQARAEQSVPQFPAIEDRRWVRTPVDAFVLAKLRREALQPANEAGRGTLIRRVTFDLTGLPPTPDEVELFSHDQRPDAYERLVDRLLANPRHGEHWGQHWLDVVRFGETEGFEYDGHRPGAWRYRDYVIGSLNADLPFDQFAREQIAGDELPQPTPATLAAVGFHRAGPVRRNAGNSDVAFSRNEVLTDMTDAIGTVFLGLTLGCARCHDHKFDPIRQKDYYRMQAFLAAAHEHDIQIADDVTVRQWNDETSRIKAEMQKIREAMQNAEGQQRDRLVEKLKAAESQLPPALPTISSVQNKTKDRTAIHVLFRGEPEKKREQVGPRTLSIFADAATPEFPADLESPKTRLADWLLSADHPLTSRVLVNRLWANHFGAGIVTTPNDFGAYGSPPSHRELLDDLANRLVAGGWHLKPVHRLLVTSSAYRQASQSPLAKIASEKDPGNRWLWKFNRRRLEAEQVRDSMLQIAGRLQNEIGGASILVPVENELVSLLYKPSQWVVTPDESQHARRSVYLLAKRNLRVPFLEVFDQPDLQSSCAMRPASIHAPQALEMLNGTFANDMAGKFADRLVTEAGLQIDRQISFAFRWIAGREPTGSEKMLSAEFLAQHSLREFALAMFNLNAFIYVD